MCKYCDGWDSGILDHRERNVYREEDEHEAPHHKGSRRKKSSPNQKGCPATGGKSHVYVWIQFNGKRPSYKWVGEGPDRHMVTIIADAVWWERRCIGCDHKNTMRYSWGKPPENIYEVREVNHGWWGNR